MWRGGSFEGERESAGFIEKVRLRPPLTASSDQVTKATLLGKPARPRVFFFLIPMNKQLCFITVHMVSLGFLGSYFCPSRHVTTDVQ